MILIILIVNQVFTSSRDLSPVKGFEMTRNKKRLSYFILV
ncbi:MAG: hypothetical protein UT48_C0017G0034 [Parcubacteria group bacterium GW2011_GWE2_39_37]|uniref:Uncharacterized protein n=1 Tax=Candidatus Falkowbacteria bacterium GW2011_GWF2_39_8 TaxID=1618642 RepID=A0A0G0SFC1_9BACT|nr:MAG: hypothetical protein UT48_C0017G0034 [Parcubacteria group bacterium GW2011_GWE2_39_37]KKR33405.1 MAG: hypothetical protein UT64_C0009G0017 [Candidatus Falkowbacteria bacterium GW2011_GWF2_39_8]